MSSIHTSIVGDAHAYTRSKVPWRLDAYRDASGETSGGVRFGWKLYHYISGGGMRTFGRTVQQEELNARQTGGTECKAEPLPLGGGGRGGAVAGAAAVVTQHW